MNKLIDEKDLNFWNSTWNNQLWKILIDIASFRKESNDPGKGKFIFNDSELDEQMAADAFFQKLKEFIKKWSDSYGIDSTGKPNQFRSGFDVVFQETKKNVHMEAPVQQQLGSAKKSDDLSFGVPLNNPNKITSLHEESKKQPSQLESPRSPVGPSSKPQVKGSIPRLGAANPSELQSQNFSVPQFGSNDQLGPLQNIGQHVPNVHNQPQPNHVPYYASPPKEPTKVSHQFDGHNMNPHSNKLPPNGHQKSIHELDSQLPLQNPIKSKPPVPHPQDNFSNFQENHAKPKQDLSEIPNPHMVESMQVSKVSSPSNMRSIAQLSRTEPMTRQNPAFMSSFDALPDQQPSPRFSVHSNSIRPLQETVTVNKLANTPIQKEEEMRGGPRLTPPRRPTFKDNNHDFDLPVEVSHNDHMERNQEPVATIMKPAPTRVSKSIGLSSIKSEHELEDRSINSRDLPAVDPLGQKIARKRSIKPLPEDEMASLVRDVAKLDKGFRARFASNKTCAHR